MKRRVECAKGGGQLAKTLSKGVYLVGVCENKMWPA